MLLWNLHGFGPWEPWGPTCTIWTTLNPRPLRIDSCQVWLKSGQATFYIGPPPQPLTPPPPHRGPLGPPWELPWTIVILHLRRSIHITWLFNLNWIWRRSLKFAKCWPLGALPLGPHGGHMYHRNNFESPAPKDDSCPVWLKANHAFFQEVEICMVLALGGPPPGPHEGHMYHMNNFEFPAPRDDSCQVWLKSDHAFSRRRWNSSLYKGPPPQPVTLHRGPLGPPWELPWTTFILHLLRYLHTTYLDYSPSGSGEEDVWNLHGFGPLGPPPRPTWGPHILFEQFWIPYP